MRHRIGLNFAAMSDGITTDDVIKKLLDDITVEASGSES
jgi:hypothetical protein